MMGLPKGLDLFSGAGGASEGYHRAGFEMTGVDIVAQPRYPFRFVQGDALEYLEAHGHEYDAIFASPPCQAYSTLSGLTRREVPTLIEPVRDLLQATGLPYAIENVVGAPLREPIRLCGSSFGLRVWRHRLFEMSHPPALVPPCSHHLHPDPIDVTGTGGRPMKPRTSPGGGLSRKPRNLAEARDAMGIYWMTRPELAEAIPPVFTEFVGHQLMSAIRTERLAA